MQTKHDFGSAYPMRVRRKHACDLYVYMYIPWSSGTHDAHPFANHHLLWSMFVAIFFLGYLLRSRRAKKRKVKGSAAFVQQGTVQNLEKQHMVLRECYDLTSPAPDK
jgi:hypothetical protein